MNEQDYEQLTLFREDSLASRLVLPGSDEARMMTVISGQRCLELYKKSGPLGSLVKMLLASSIWHSTRCYLTWKVSATPAKRLLFRLVPQTLLTDATEFASWPTPTAADIYTDRLKSSQQKGFGRHSLTLGHAVQLWPTPTTDSATNRTKKYAQEGAPLTAAVKMWPTPRCGGSKGSSPAGAVHGDLAAVAGGQLNPTWVEWLMGFPTGWTDLNA